MQRDIVSRPGILVKQPQCLIVRQKQKNADQKIKQSLKARLACCSHMGIVHSNGRKKGQEVPPLHRRALNYCTVALYQRHTGHPLHPGPCLPQVKLTPRTCKAAAFCSRNGLFEWNVMLFRLCNATFQQLMDSVLRSLQWETCLIYLANRDVPEMLQ